MIINFMYHTTNNFLNEILKGIPKEKITMIVGETKVIDYFLIYKKEQLLKLRRNKIKRILNEKHNT